MLRPSIRLCFLSGFAGMKVKYDQMRQKFYITGATSSTIQRFSLFSQLYNLTQVHRAFDAEECYNLLGSNASDVSSHLTSHYSSGDSRFTVPAPTFVDRHVLLTGYNVTDYEMTQRKEKVFNVLTNFVNFDSSTLSLIGLFCFLVVTCALIRIQILQMKRNPRSNRNSFSTFKLIRNVCITVKKMLQGRARTSRLLSLSIFLLLFILFTCFIVLFKTDQVVMEAPVIISSYEQILHRPDTFAVYYEALATCSDKFRTSPVGSLRHKLWLKTINSGLQEQDYLVRKTKFNEAGIEVTIKRYSSIVAQRWVLVIPQRTSQLAKHFGCSFSPEGEIWKLIVVEQSGEVESLEGMAVSRSFTHHNYFVHSMRRLTESHLFEQTFVNSIRGIGLGYAIRKTSIKHKLKQTVACSGDVVSNDASKFVYNLKLEYYSSLFLVVILGYTSAAVALLCELFWRICISKSVKKNYDTGQWVYVKDRERESRIGRKS